MLTPFARLQVFVLVIAVALRKDGYAEITTVAVSGQAAPAVGTGVTFQSFGAPALNNVGQTVFQGYLQGNGVSTSNNNGLFVESPSGVRLVARQGTHYTKLGSYVLNDAGQLAFSAQWGSDRDSIFADRGNGLELVARTDVAVPLVPGVDIRMGTSTFTDFAPSFNEKGQITFHSSVKVRGTPTYATWLSQNDGEMEVVAMRDYRPEGVTPLLSDVNTGQPRISDHGHLAFKGFRKTNSGIMKTDLNGNLIEVAMVGEMAPGMKGTFYNLYDHPKVNNAGHVAFWGTAGAMGIWSEGGGNGLKLVAKWGGRPPGVDNGLPFGHLSPDLILSGSGRVAFSAFLWDPVTRNDSNITGIWAQGPNFSLRLVALQGQPAPGGEPTDTFGHLYHATYPAINAFGQVAFITSIPGTGKRAIFAQDRRGVLRRIVAVGDEIDIDSGPGIHLTTVTGLEFLGRAGDQEGRSTGFNDFGQVAFRAQLGGNSGIFVSNLIAVPEPTTSILFFVSVAFLLAHRHWRR